MSVSNVFTFISSMGPEWIERLYNDSYSTTGVFRYLSPPVQQLVLRLLIGDGTIVSVFKNHRQAMAAFFEESSECITFAIQLRVFVCGDEEGNDKDRFCRSRLNEAFRASLAISLQTDLTLPPARAGDNGICAKRRMDTRLQQIPWKTMEDVQMYIFQRKSTDIGPQLKQLVRMANLITGESQPKAETAESRVTAETPKGPPSKRRRADATSTILTSAQTVEQPVFEKTGHRVTKEGFHYLLCDLCTQLWVLVEQYLRSRSTGENDFGEVSYQVVTLLFKFAHWPQKRQRPPKPRSGTSLEGSNSSELVNFLFFCRRSDFSGVHREHLSFFTKLGLLIGYKDPTTDEQRDWIAATPTAIYFCSPPSCRPDFLQDGDQSNGSLIVETNNRVYAYTSSPFQVALLSLFCEMKFSLPNFSAGVITRESVTRALRQGISSEQILTYMLNRAHPCMRKQDSILPESVVEQINLWEKERRRVATHPQSTMLSFQSKLKYDDVRDSIATALGESHILCENAEKLVLVMSKRAFEAVKVKCGI